MKICDLTQFYSPVSGGVRRYIEQLDFERDDIVRILSPEGAPLGVGRISCDSATARRNLGRKGLKPLIHCDYLYLE